MCEDRTGRAPISADREQDVRGFYCWWWQMHHDFGGCFAFDEM